SAPHVYFSAFRVVHRNAHSLPHRSFSWGTPLWRISPLAPSSVADGKTGLMVGWLLDLIDERDGVVRSGDLGFAVGVGDQDVGAQPERAGPLAGAPRAERQGRAEVEPVHPGAGSPQRIQHASVGLGLGL